VTCTCWKDWWLSARRSSQDCLDRLGLYLSEFSFVANRNVAFAEIAFSELVRWWTDALNVLLTRRTPVGRYRDGVGLLNTRAAYREARTLERLFITATRICG
jgi:hypothetical protein